MKISESSPLNFPAKLYKIIEEESNEIIRWNSDGLSFKIVSSERFSKEILPKYFRLTHFSSVQRQLSHYGFRSISRGENKRSFFHPLFKRGNWEAVRRMTRASSNPKNNSKNINSTVDSQLNGAVDGRADTLLYYANGVKRESNPFLSNKSTYYNYSDTSNMKWSHTEQSTKPRNIAYDNSVFNSYDKKEMQQPNNRHGNLFSEWNEVTKIGKSNFDSSIVKFPHATFWDSEDNHFTSDFLNYNPSIDSLSTTVSVDPIDYSIPMLFQQDTYKSNNTPLLLDCFNESDIIDLMELCREL